MQRDIERGSAHPHARHIDTHTEIFMDRVDREKNHAHGRETPELAAAQQRASHRIFGVDTGRRFQPAGKALAAWYDAVSRQKPPPSGGLFEALETAIGIGYAGCPEGVRASNALVIMYLAGRIFRKHEYIGQYLRAAHAA